MIIDKGATMPLTIKPTDKYSQTLDLADVEAFLKWAEQSHILFRHEIPPCWKDHPALIDILAACAVERMQAIEAMLGSNGATERLAVWWLHFEQLRLIWRRWTDNCRIKHTPER